MFEEWNLLVNKSTVVLARSRAVNSISTTAFMSKVHFSIAFINSLTTLPQD